MGKIGFMYTMKAFKLELPSENDQKPICHYSWWITNSYLDVNNVIQIY